MKQTSIDSFLRLSGFAFAMSALAAFAGNNCHDGVAKALPVKDGAAPAIDGSLADWDLTAPVLCWNADEFADQQNAALYFMYDKSFLYFGAEMALFDHDATNENRPEDRFWDGDALQLRLSTDKSLPFPLPGKTNAGDPSSPYFQNDAVTCVNLWKNTKDGSDNLFVTPRANLDGDNVNHPEGSQVKIVAGDKSLVFESRIPWSAIGVADGACPFAPGERMAAIVDIKWFPSGDGHMTAAIFNSDPGAFAFLNPGSWGQVEFLAEGNLPPSGETFKSIAEAARNGQAPDTEGCARIAFNLPKKAKVSVNIFDENGGVIRELIGGEEHDAGEVEVFWDGRDALGFPCEIGKAYRWGAYAHDGIDVEYFGTVGTSGTPPYETPDRKGCWGGDHGPAVAAAADSTGRYFVWYGSEGGRGIVKTDLDGNTIWRSSPFVCGGWGNYSCIAANGEKLFLVHETRSGRDVVAQLVRLDASTGNYELFPNGAGSIMLGVAKTEPVLPDNCPTKQGPQFECAGIAVLGDDVFISDYTGNRILVHDAVSGEPKRELAVPGPRGICIRDGAIYVVQAIAQSADAQPAFRCAVARVDPANGAIETVVDDGLVAPYGIAVDTQGRVHVSDLGTSQQIKTFENGRLVRALGKEGGRAFLGRIDTDAFLLPFGIAIDEKNTLLVPEASAPKIVNLIDAESGRSLHRYYGYTAYSPSNIPDCDDPLLEYYSLSGPESFARARIPDEGGAGFPDASWDFPGAGQPEFGCIMNTMNMPEVMRCANGRKYLVPDGIASRANGEPITICMIDGDAMIPVASFTRAVSLATPNSIPLEIWMDANGDHKIQPEEKTILSEVAGRPVRPADADGGLTLTPNGDAFLLTTANFLVGIPCRGFSDAGVPQWDIGAAYIAVPEIVPGLAHMHCTWRSGSVGWRRDSQGNFYTSVACDVKYATEEYAKYMHQGMGHTADMNAVFLFKYDPSGKLVWRVGRKAVGSAKAGEILNHWVHAGLIGDDYTVAASEWGCFTVYTADGFYVDRLFDTPGLPGRGIPYTFGGEDFSGRIQYFPQRDEVWAYNSGHTFRVIGFEKGRVKGEWRTDGEVTLELVKPLSFPGAKPKEIGKVAFSRENGRLVFTAHVDDATPLVNVAPDVNAVFKGGDAVGFEIGPACEPEAIPERNRDAARRIGFTRVLAARINGADHVVAFKPFTDQAKREQEYETPAGGLSAFEFVGDIPDATVEFTQDANGKGYTAKIAVPAEFLEIDLDGEVFFDAEALLSGDGGRGLQTVQRVYLNNPDSSATTMVDDVPTEARLHPAGWRKLEF